jgi:probable O-glycosylation ligase (exosortase A-associated)
MLFAALSILTLPSLKRRPPGSLSLTTLMVWLLAAWVTFSTLLAVLPEVAFQKWSWGIQSILCSVLIPIFFQTRPEIESCLAAFYSALLAHVLTAAAKGALGGGGYQTLSTLEPTNSGLGESSTLATAAVMIIPLAYYVFRQSLAATKFWKLAFAVQIAASLSAVVSTGARTGLVATGSLLLFGARRVKTKIAVVAAAIVLVGIISPFLQESYSERMKTISEPTEEASANGRLEVWEWTLRYVAQHPLGGGFGIAETNGLQADGGGRAFHSIYFEVLGEQGIPGFGIFFLLLISSTLSLYYASRFQARSSDLEWARQMSTALFSALVVFLTGAAFVGVAFQPYLYILIGLHLAVRRLSAVDETLDPKTTEESAVSLGHYGYQ